MPEPEILRVGEVTVPLLFQSDSPSLEDYHRGTVSLARSGEQAQNASEAWILTVVSRYNCVINLSPSDCVNKPQSGHKPAPASLFSLLVSLLASQLNTLAKPTKGESLGSMLVCVYCICPSLCSQACHYTLASRVQTMASTIIAQISRVDL